MLDRVRERIHPQEFIEARAVAEAAPLPTRPTSKPLGWGRAMLDHLREQDATDAVEQATNARHTVVARLVTQLNAPLLQVDFAAWLADDWAHVNARLDDLDDATVRDLTQAKARYQYGTQVATAPLLSELTELKAVTLVNWRQALRVHAEDELALYGAKAEVA
jgi:predicted glutamine amidotransferase